jgi:hypothetical protein
MSDLPLNLSSLNAEQFEDLVEAIFRGKMPPKAKTDATQVETIFAGTVVAVTRSGRGQDGGLDLLVTTLVTDCIATRLLKWVVQCKHRTNGRSIGPHDFSKEFTFPDVILHHNANSYLLVCNTHPSAKLKAHLDKLTNDSSNQHYAVWDYDQVCEAILSDQSVLQRFFPREYERQRGLVEGSSIADWARQHRESISDDAFAALNNLVPFDSSGINHEDDER